MGQILSLRKSSTVRSSSNRGSMARKGQREKNESAIDVRTISVDYEKQNNLKGFSSEQLMEIRSKQMSASAREKCKDTNNNNYQSSNKSTEYLTKDSSSNNNDGYVASDNDTGSVLLLKKHPNKTYPNEATEEPYHSSSPKSSLGTCRQQMTYHGDTTRSIYSEPTVQSEPVRRNQQPRKRRRNKSTSTHHHHNHHQHFGYDIRNVQEFLSKCSLISPANIPVVLSGASTLYQTRPGFQLEIPLPLGMVVNAVFKIQQWLYVQTPHAEEGYVSYDTCLPLGILPTTRPPSIPAKPERCWESTKDVYPKPGLWTETDPDYLLFSCRSEGARTPACSEKNVDSLYLKAASQCNLEKTYSQIIRKLDSKGSSRHTKTPSPLVRETLLAVHMNYKSSAVSVKKGDVVTLLACKEIRDNHSITPRQWFYIRTRCGVEAFIPAEVAGHGFL